MPGCVIAVALIDDGDNDDNHGTASVLPRPAHGECAAIVCAVDVPALTISGYLLSAPPGRAQREQTGAVSSSSSDDPSKESLKGCYRSSEAAMIGAQLEALLQQVQWWREGNQRDAAAARASDDLYVMCLWSTQCSGDTDLRSEIQNTVERAACIQPVVRIVDSFPGSDTEERVEAQIRQLLARPQALSVWKTEYSKQYRWFLVAANEILAHWKLHEETKLEGAFALEIYTEAAKKHLRFNPAAQEVFARSSPQAPSLVGMLSPFCHSRLAKERLRQDFERLLNWLTQLSALLALESASGYTDGENVVLGKIVTPVKWLCDEPLPPFCQMISENLHPVTPNVNVEAAVMTTQRFQISARLHELRDQIQQCESEIERVKRQVCTSDFNIELEKSHTEIESDVAQVASTLRLPAERVKIVYEDDSNASLRGLRVLLRVSRQDAHRVHQLHSSIVTVLRSSKASGVLFSTNALDTLSAAWKTLKQSCKETEEALVQELSSVLASTYVRFLNELVDSIITADVLIGFVSASREKQFVRPRLANFEEHSWSLRLINAVDPIPARATRARGYEEKCCAFDVELSSDSGKSFLVLSSKDAEVNNTILHAMGAIVALNQIGCFVPCKFAELPVYDSVLLRTGSSDQQLFGRSTFMTEMVEMRLILSNMTQKSLVLIDDLCRGTSNDLMNTCDFPEELIYLVQTELKPKRMESNDDASTL